jgi:hypothetical protein
MSFYATHSPFTDPADYTSLYDNLPSSVDALSQIVRGVLLHPLDAEFMGIPFSTERLQEERIRPVGKKLSRLQTLISRPLQERMASQCYGFATLLCSMLRHQGVAARVRSGFARYLASPTLVYNHWITEYFNGQRWVLVDPQLDPQIHANMNLNFDPLDVPRDMFLTGDVVWRRCRSGEDNPKAYGYDEVQGMEYIGCQMVLDFAALNKMELLAIDRWGITLNNGEDWDEKTLQTLDEVAALSRDVDENLAALRNRYEGDARLRVPDSLINSQNDI